MLKRNSVRENTKKRLKANDFIHTDFWHLRFDYF